MLNFAEFLQEFIQLNVEIHNLIVPGLGFILFGKFNEIRHLINSRLQSIFDYHLLQQLFCLFFN